MDQRKWLRVAVSPKDSVRVALSRYDLPVECIQLSMGGLHLASPIHFAPAESLELMIVSPHSAQFGVSGIVIWCNDRTESYPNNYHLGLQFESTADHSQLRALYRSIFNRQFRLGDTVHQHITTPVTQATYVDLDLRYLH